VITTSGESPWVFVKQILYNDREKSSIKNSIKKQNCVYLPQINPFSIKIDHFLIGQFKHKTHILNSDNYALSVP